MIVQISLSSTLMYHGSPCAGLNLKSLTKGVLFLTHSKQIAKDYALGKVHFTGKCIGERSPTVYHIRCSPHKLFDLRKPDSQEVYDRIRQEHPDEELPKLSSEGLIMRHTGLPSYGNIGGLKLPLRQLGYDGMWVDEGSQGISLAIFNPEILTIEHSEVI
jgi:hypothetical protein